jgi:hypothetical protein
MMQSTHMQGDDMTTYIRSMRNTENRRQYCSHQENQCTRILSTAHNARNMTKRHEIQSKLDEIHDSDGNNKLCKFFLSANLARRVCRLEVAVRCELSPKPVNENRGVRNVSKMLQLQVCR